MTKPITKMTPREVVRFHSAMEKRCSVKFVNSEILRKSAIAVAKRFFGDLTDVFSEVVDPDLLKLRPCCVNGVILLPYKVGTSKVSPRMQVLTAVHESTHARRQSEYKGNALNWYGEYFTKDTFRAAEEESCEEAENEVLYWQDGEIPDFSLNGYFLDSTGMAVAKSAYRGHVHALKSIGRGQTTHFAARQAIKILRAQGVTRAN